jgi:fumarate reductase subunit C
VNRATTRLERAGDADVASQGEPPQATTRAYSPRPGATWWLRNRRYVFYMVREFTSIPIAIWVMLFVVEISRLGAGKTGYQPFGGPVWIVFSLICLVFALWHSVTFLGLAGRIIRVPLGDRYVPPQFIVGAMFGLLFVATVLIGAFLVLGGR